MRAYPLHKNRQKNKRTHHMQFQFVCSARTAHFVTYQFLCVFRQQGGHPGDTAHRVVNLLFESESGKCARDGPEEIQLVVSTRRQRRGIFCVLLCGAKDEQLVLVPFVPCDFRFRLVAAICFALFDF